MPTNVTITVKGVKAIVKDLTQVTERVISKISLDVTANLKGTTPVDTGWARSNWIPSLGARQSSPVGSRTGVTNGPQNAGVARVASYKLSSGSVFISNNVPYIGLLDQGHSKKAPAGFVARAVDKAVRVDLGTVIRF